jgi:hypothetical protein
MEPSGFPAFSCSAGAARRCAVGIGSVMMARFQRLRPTALPLSQVETLAEFEDN